MAKGFVAGVGGGMGWGAVGPYPLPHPPPFKWCKTAQKFLDPNLVPNFGNFTHRYIHAHLKPLI